MGEAMSPAKVHEIYALQSRVNFLESRLTQREDTVSFLQDELARLGRDREVKYDAIVDTIAIITPSMGVDEHHNLAHAIMLVLDSEEKV